MGSSCNIANRIDYCIPSDAISKAKINSQIFRALFKYGLSSFILLVLPIKNYTREALLEAKPVPQSRLLRSDPGEPLEQKLIDTLSPEYKFDLKPEALWVTLIRMRLALTCPKLNKVQIILCLVAKE